MMAESRKSLLIILLILLYSSSVLLLIMSVILYRTTSVKDRKLGHHIMSQILLLSGFLYCVMVGTLYSSTVAAGDWMISMESCAMVGATQAFLVAISFFSLVLLSLERYFHIFRPLLKIPWSYLIVVVVMGCLGLFYAPFVLYEKTSFVQIYGRNHSGLACITLWYSSHSYSRLLSWLSVFMIIIGFTAVSISSLKIYKLIKKQKSRFSVSHQDKNPSARNNNGLVYKIRKSLDPEMPNKNPSTIDQEPNGALSTANNDKDDLKATHMSQGNVQSTVATVTTQPIQRQNTMKTDEKRVDIRLVTRLFVVSVLIIFQFILYTINVFIQLVIGTETSAIFEEIAFVSFLTGYFLLPISLLVSDKTWLSRMTK